MGVLNVTPDSFSDGGLYHVADKAFAHGLRMMEEGADIIDVGGESTRPGSNPITEEEEQRRVLPVLERLAAEGVPVSIDTSKPSTAEEAVKTGAQVINDVTGLTLPEMRRIAAEAGVTVCIMHSKGSPRTMQDNPTYEDVLKEVLSYLKERTELALRDGIQKKRIWIDPGIGFGKTVEHNLALLRGISELKTLGYPVLVGVSRKSVIGALTGVKEPERRVAGSLAAGLTAVQEGANILRTHDVSETIQALRVWSAI